MARVTIVYIDRRAEAVMSKNGMEVPSSSHRVSCSSQILASLSNITCSRGAHVAPLNRHMSCGTDRAQCSTRSIMSSYLSV